MRAQQAAWTIVLFAAVLLPGSAAGQGVCVSCVGPDRDYRCTVKDSEKVQHVRGSGRAIDFVCISEIARSGGHQSCKVGTGYSGPCIGQHFEIDVGKMAAGDGTKEKATTETADQTPSATANKAPPPQGPPQTLEELARDAMSKSKDQISAADKGLRKAGDAVGGSLKKTWDCVASFFSRC